MAYSYRANHLVIFRGNSVNDPEAEGYIEGELAVYAIAPDPRMVGELTTMGDGRIRGHKTTRREIYVEPIEFNKFPDGDHYQDIGQYYRLKEQIFTCEFYWIYRVYNIGANPEAGSLPRADYDHTDLSSQASSPSFWNLTTATTPGVCPLLVVLSDDPKPGRDGNLYTWEPTFKQAYPRYR